MNLDLFSAPLARLMESGATLRQIAQAAGQPMGTISHQEQILTLMGPDLQRVLVYRISLGALFWMVMVPDDTRCTFSAHDQSLGFDRLADLLQGALR